MYRVIYNYSNRHSRTFLGYISLKFKGAKQKIYGEGVCNRLGITCTSTSGENPSCCCIVRARSVKLEQGAPW